MHFDLRLSWSSFSGSRNENVELCCGMGRDGRDQDGGHQRDSRSTLDVVEVNPERSRQAEMVAVDVSVEGCRGWTWQEARRKSREQIY